MKSAYELAMERLEESDPSADKPLTDEQKTQLAEVDQVYQGKIAEREIFLQQKLEEALAGPNPRRGRKDTSTDQKRTAPARGGSRGREKPRPR